MRRAALLGTIFAATLAFGPAGGVPAEAGTPAASGASPTSRNLVEKAGWRRYCRRHGCGPEAVFPDAAAGPQLETGIAAEVEAEPDAPAVIVLPPPRPLSCGQYRYWNGARCVDARFTDPYLGPK